MASRKILYVCQEIMPYLPETELSALCRQLAQAIQERGNEIRTFMPRYGCINERRNQLHEVIRLSGMNLIIDDNDHQLIIKVASIPSARIQIYFIDNDDYFTRKATLCDADGKEFADNGGDLLFTFGSSADGIANGAVFGGMVNEKIFRNNDIKNPALSGEMLLHSLKAGDVLLVKASRGAAAERVIRYIKENRDRICL